MSNSTYELAAEFSFLMELDDPTDEQMERLDDLAMELPDKLEGCCKYLANIQPIIDGLKAEEKRLAEKRKVLENKVQRFKHYIQSSMEIAGMYDVEAGTFTVKLQQNPVSVRVLDESLIPVEFMVTKTSLDKSLLKKALKDGAVAGASLESSGLSLRIK